MSTVILAPSGAALVALTEQRSPGRAGVIGPTRDNTSWTQHTRKEPDDGLERQAEEQEKRGQGRFAKENLGKARDDEQMEREGQSDQTVSNLKQAGEKVKDAFKKG